MDREVSGRERREERVPLDALVELRSEDGDDVLEADGLDLSLGGLSLRAPFVPETGARLLCFFRCPPTGEPVEARGEVVWADWEGPRSGAFGLRFLELDTRSAKAIRNLVDPGGQLREPEPEETPPARAATMVIDGLGAPIEADLRAFEDTHVVLEQELTFLKLGRGVEVDVPGRGKQRGRIASVELRHGPLDVPTLVFGVLVDEVRAPEPVVAQRAAPPPPDRVLAHARAPEPSLPPEAPSVLDTWPERPMFAEQAPSEPQNETARSVAQVTAPAVVASPRTRTLDETRTFKVQEDDDAQTQATLSDEDYAEVSGFAPVQAQLKALHRSLTALTLLARGRLLPTLRTALVALRTLLERNMPEAKQRISSFRKALAELIAKQRVRLSTLRDARVRKLAQRTTSPAPRVQKAPKIVKREAQRAPEPTKRALPRNQRLWALGLAALGVGLGVYALAPRSEAKHDPSLSLPVPATDSFTQLPSAASADNAAMDPVAAPGDTQMQPGTASLAAQVAPAGAPSEPTLGSSPTPAQLGTVPALPTTQTPAPSSDVVAGHPEPGLTRVFGAQQVPEGRTFALRMSGPVEGLEGESREDGFTVRVPGRLALDRASPIATSHRAVARAMILNRGDYAELTVDFLPGMRPKYQVTAKDASIEVTLERQ